ncbi:MAG: DUF4286 family protein [Phocaeicola sp.]|uniref:DUF4286 family protein n=1 Tax=Phocaeicola sp. TaxID=2773926 RepID=UPI003F9EF3B6
MIVYNTTYHVELPDARNFVTWVDTYLIPEVEKTGMLRNPRLTRILTHKEHDSECFSMQWEAESLGMLQKFHTQYSPRITQELNKVFKNKVLGFDTLMEVVR